MIDGPLRSVDAAEAASLQLHGIQFREAFLAVAVASTHTTTCGARAVGEIDNGRRGFVLSRIGSDRISSLT